MLTKRVIACFDVDHGRVVKGVSFVELRDAGDPVELAALYDPALIAAYESVRRARGGQGAALIDRRGLCQGCRLVRPSAELSRARAGDQIVRCGGCSRILIYE